MGKKKTEPLTVEEIIKRTVLATRLSCANEAKDVFKATEKRLYAYPVLLEKIKDDEEMIQEVEKHGVRGKSKSITRFVRNGTRLDHEDIKAAVILDLQATIASDTYEVEKIRKALEQIEGDEYKDIVRMKYFEQKTDEEIAEALHCAPRTVRTHKSALVGRLSVFLYGADALS